MSNTIQAPQNTYKKAKSTSVKTHPFASYFIALAGMLSMVIGAVLLNQSLSVRYWDIDAGEPLRSQIDTFFGQKKELDFWHTRAGLIQETLLATIPDIKHVEVSRVLPDGLQVVVVARIPLALWEDTQTPLHRQDVRLVDQQAVPYRSIQAGEALDLPLLRLPASDLFQAMAIVKFLAQYQQQRAMALSEVIVEHRQWRLNFSHGEQWQLQQANVEQDMIHIMDTLKKSRWKNGYWRVDARIPQRWFLRPAQQEVI